jgi:ABC-2 type transporter
MSSYCFRLVPLDFAIIKREHFNRHYSCFAYYLAFNLADAPLLIFNAILYECIVHPMTGIPFELNRFLVLLVVAVTLSFAAQIVGMFCGSMNDIKVRNFMHTNHETFD